MLKSNGNLVVRSEQKVGDKKPGIEYCIVKFTLISLTIVVAMQANPKPHCICLEKISTGSSLQVLVEGSIAAVMQCTLIFRPYLITFYVVSAHSCIIDFLISIMFCLLFL